MKRDDEFHVVDVPGGALPEVNRRWVSLIHELPMAKPAYMCGDRKYLEWLYPEYGTSAEVEVMDFLYALVRLLKPDLIVEGGCYLGYGSYALGRGAQDNGRGRVVTCDTDPDRCQQARIKVQSLPVEVRQCSILDVAELTQCDLAFLDSGDDEKVSHDTRIGSLHKMKQGALAVMHDTRNEKLLRPAVDAAGMPSIHFETWRGLSIIQC